MDLTQATHTYVERMVDVAPDRHEVSRPGTTAAGKIKILLLDKETVGAIDGALAHNILTSF